MPQKIHAIYVLSPQISYDTKKQARTFDTLVLFVPYNEPYLHDCLPIQRHLVTGIPVIKHTCDKNQAPNLLESVLNGMGRMDGITPLRLLGLLEHLR